MYQGHEVFLQILAHAPEDEEPGLKVDTSGGPPQPAGQVELDITALYRTLRLCLATTRTLTWQIWSFLGKRSCKCWVS
jgi:hypothetical protein